MLFCQINRVLLWQPSPDQGSSRNDHPKSPCCVPQTHHSSPCYQSVASAIQTFDLLGFIGDRSGNLRDRIAFPPWSQGDARPLQSFAPTDNGGRSEAPVHSTSHSAGS